MALSPLKKGKSLEGLAFAPRLPYFWNMKQTVSAKMGFLCLMVMLFAGIANAQETTPANEPLRFKETEFNFGKIPQSKPVYHVFKLANTTGKPVKIDNVQASCGCTTPEWSRDEIAAGANAEIKVGYNAAAEGAFDKTIVVSYAGTSKVLRIKGEVWKTPSSPAPANGSVQLLNSKLQR